MCTSKVHTRGPVTNALLSEIPSLGDTSTFCKERGGCAVRSLLADRTNAHTSLPRPLRPQVSDPGSPRFDQNGVRLPAPAPRRRPSRTHIPPALQQSLEFIFIFVGRKGHRGCSAELIYLDNTLYPTLKNMIVCRRDSHPSRRTRFPAGPPCRPRGGPGAPLSPRSCQRAWAPPEFSSDPLSVSICIYLHRL